MNTNAIARRTVRFLHLSFIAQLLPCCSVCALLLNVCRVAQCVPCCSFVPFCWVCAIFVHRRHWATNLTIGIIIHLYFNILGFKQSLYSIIDLYISSKTSLLVSIGTFWDSFKVSFFSLSFFLYPPFLHPPLLHLYLCWNNQLVGCWYYHWLSV